MHPDAMKAIMDEVDKAIEAGESPDDAMDRLIPRMFYTGHKVIHTYRMPDRRAKWECKACQHQWISEEGDQCPECKDCKHVWGWVAEPYGEQDRSCKYCGVTLKEDMGEEKFEAYIKREREGRKRLKD